MATTYPAGQRPRIRITNDHGGLNPLPDLVLTKINSKTAYFRSSYVVGEMAVSPPERVEIIRHADGTPVLETEQWPPLTPYDTGERLEPSVWVTPDRRRPEEHDHDRYGKVDFNDDTDTTIGTVHGERVDGTHVLVIYSHETDTETRVNLNANLDIYDVSGRSPQTGAVEFQGQTPRGFGYSEFVDDQGVVLDVQESSLATERRLWIGAHGLGRSHLTETQVREIRDLLTHWLGE